MTLSVSSLLSAVKLLLIETNADLWNCGMPLKKVGYFSAVLFLGKKRLPCNADEKELA